ncbi:NAD(P)H-dependent glycerol-3-phosphate dehydrogenase [Verrucomicrobiota bacterium]
MKKNITIIGDGGWGTALAIVLTQNGHNVTVWSPFPSHVELILESRENKLFLPGVALPSEINWTTNHKDSVKDTHLAVLAVPTKYFRSVLKSFADILSPQCPILSVAKGLDQETRKRMTQVAEEILGPRLTAALSGPSHAEEVARNIPTAVVAASSNQEYCREIQNIFSNKRFRVYSSEDIAGTELGGALKNIIAIAVGMSDGLGFGDNTRAALITRGLAEITRLGCANGAKALTFSGLSGMGDLIVTCTSKLSRNRSVGEKLGKGENIAQIMKNMSHAAEGVWNCAIARDMAREADVEVPITDEVHAIISEGKNPLDAVQSLMEREMKPEA